jgi:hypothetical protein
VARKIAAAIGNVTVEPTPRANPITHRQFDTTALVRAFPHFRATPLDEGLAETIRSMPVKA